VLTKIVETPGFNALAKGRYGYVLYNRNDTYVGRAIEKYGEFSELEVNVFRQVCRNGDVVVEVGANIGTHTQAFAQLVGPRGRVHAFEPQRIVFQTLCANMALNSIENVECHHAAVGAEDGFVQVPDIRYDVPTNFGGLDVRQFKSGRKVRLVRLDSFLDLPRLGFLKVDVEGMELEVIRGARELIGRHKPVLYVENNKGVHSQSLIELLWSLDYRLFWHLPPLFNPGNFAGDSEDLFPGIVSVNMLCFPKSAKANLTGFDEVVDSGFHPLNK
jgi:FkbM family methyltransferase